MRVSRYARRWRLIIVALGCQLALWSLLRVVLYAALREEAFSARSLATILAIGASFDLLTGLTAVLPLILIVSVFRLRWLGRPWVRNTLLAPLFFAVSFNMFVEYFFFEEYSARYNHLALDYLMYPDEVFGSIFASYNMPLFVGLAGVMAAGLTWWTARRALPAIDEWRWRDRLTGAAAVVLLALGLSGVWSVAPFAVGSSRVGGELALNGWAQLVRAYLTSHLDYEVYYAMVPAADASARVARLIGQPAPAVGLARHF